MPRKAKFLKELEAELEQVHINLYNPHVNQQAIIDDQHRFKVVVCGRQFGKTTFAVNELLYHALTNENAIYWYVAPTYKQAKMIAWTMLNNAIRDLPPELVEKKNEQELEVILGNNSKICLKGVDNEDSLRGAGINGIVCDEYAYFKPKVFDLILRPLLAAKQGWAIFIGTPHGYNHFYKLFLQGKSGRGPWVDWKSWQFKSADNPYLKAEEIEAARQTSSPEVFAQEWEADFKKFEGLVFKEFDLGTHVKEFDPNPGWTFYRAMDFGTYNPTVCLWIGVDRDDNVYVFDEHFESSQPIDYHAGVILARYPNFSYRATFGDPSAAQETLDYARWGLFITPATRFFISDKGTEESWVRLRISQIESKLRVQAVSKQPRLFIHPRCKNLIAEFQAYEWDISLGKEKAKKENDHGIDALGYFICSYGGVTVERKRYIYEPNSSRTGY